MELFNPMFLPLMFLAVIGIEGIVEYVLGIAFNKLEALKPYSWLLPYASMVFGVFLAFWYKLDAVTLVGLPYSPVGVVITGCALGRGGNFVHQIFSLIGAWTENLRK